MAETETTMLAHLERHLSARSQGVGRRYVLATHVRSGAAWGDQGLLRTADAVAMDTWPSGGLLLHGYEVKVSRSDWLTELKDPTKCQPVKRFCDRWWLVCPPGVAQKDELPDGWGMLVLATRATPPRWDREAHAMTEPGTEAYLRVSVQAPALDPEPVTRSFLACLLRATYKTGVRSTGAED